MIDEVLNLASIWPDWDNVPNVVEVPGESQRTYTPHKAIRRVADHLVDHLAEIDAKTAGSPTLPDEWHASAITTFADLAPFTVEDLEEARSRLRRLGLIWDLRVRGMSNEELDASRDGDRTFREIAFHVAESVFYAESVARYPVAP